MKILITAFEPFGGSLRNSSLETLHSLPDSYMNYEIVKLELPVIFDRCGEVLRKTAETVKPDAIICLGQAEGRNAVTPEYAALNVNYTTSSDNAGNAPALNPVVKDGPAAYLATLPVRELVDAMTEKGIPARISFSAGTYVCNNLMYHALHDTVGTGVRAGFIHLPLSFDNGKGTPYLPPETLRESILTAVEVLGR